MAEREIISVKILKGDGNYNKVFIVELKDDGKGILKPKSGEDTPARAEHLRGQYYLRERAAYIVSSAFDLGLVPPTVLRLMPSSSGEAQGDASLQEFVMDSRTPIELSSAERRKIIAKHELRLIALFIFDYLIFNSDRHWQNLVISNDKIWAIDHGISMSPIFMRFEPFEEYWIRITQHTNPGSDIYVPPHIIEKLVNVAKDAPRRKKLESMLKGIFDTEELQATKEVDAFFKRLDSLLDTIETFGMIPAGSLMDYDGIKTL